MNQIFPSIDEDVFEDNSADELQVDRVKRQFSPRYSSTPTRERQSELNGIIQVTKLAPNLVTGRTSKYKVKMEQMKKARFSEFSNGII